MVGEHRNYLANIPLTSVTPCYWMCKCASVQLGTWVCGTGTGSTEGTDDAGGTCATGGTDDTGGTGVTGVTGDFFSNAITWRTSH